MQGAGGIGGLMARTDGTGTTFYHSDGNGNVTMLVNSAGTMQAKYLYDPYGNTLGMWGTLAVGNTYRFSSKEIEPKSGIYYYGYRYYEPNLQRWLNRDPIQESGGLNLYGFVGNGPINRVDPLGLFVAANSADYYASGQAAADAMQEGAALGDALNSLAQSVNSLLTDQNMWDYFAMDTDGASRAVEPLAAGIGAGIVKIASKCPIKAANNANWFSSFSALKRAKGSLKNKSRVKKRSSNIMTLGFLVLCLFKMRGFGCKQRHRVVFQFPNPTDWQC